ncbi:MAG: TlpA disulfide reductase family protein [bacterium]
MRAALLGLGLLLVPVAGRTGGELPTMVADPGAIGAPLPVMLAADMDGNPAELKQFIGKPLLLSLWASWCAPCKQELPILEELHQVWGPRGLQVVGLSIEADRAVVRRAATAFGLTFPVLHDAEQVVEFTFLTTQIPATRLYDRAGRLVWRGRGVRGDDPELRAAIERVLAK